MRAETIIQKAKCLIGIHQPYTQGYTEYRSFRTNRKGRSKKKYHTTKITVRETRPTIAYLIWFINLE